MAPRKTPPPPEPFRPDDERNLIRTLAQQITNPAPQVTRAMDDDLGALPLLAGAAALPGTAYIARRGIGAAGRPGIGAGMGAGAGGGATSAGVAGSIGRAPLALGPGPTVNATSAIPKALGAGARALGPGNPVASIADDVLGAAAGLGGWLNGRTPQGWFRSTFPSNIPAGATSAWPRAATAAAGAAGGAAGVGLASTIPGLQGFKSTIPAGPTSAFPRVASAAGGLGDDAAAAAAGGRGGLLGRVTSGMTRPTSLRSGLTRGAVGMGLNLAGNMLSEQVGGNDTIAGRFLSGAGAGGGLGAIAGPKGALVGALVGGLGNVLLGGGKEGPNGTEVLDNALGYSGLDPERQNQIRAVYGVMSELGDETEALNMVGQMIMEEMTASRQQEADLQTMLATQAMTAEFFQPFTEQLLQGANLRAGITEQLADSLPGPYQAVARQQAVTGISSAQRLAAAYSQQAQLLPVMHLAELNRQREFQQPAAQGGDLQALLAQAGIA